LVSEKKMIAKASACKAAPRVLPLRALALSAALAMGLPLSPAQAAGSDSHGVTLSIANNGDEPIRCFVLFAHFVPWRPGPFRPATRLRLRCPGRMATAPSGSPVPTAGA